VSRALFAVCVLAAGACVLAAGACTGDLDPAWQLDHDRIVAVRATPPSIAPGEQSTIDALLATKGARTSVAPPELATVVSPMSLAGVLAADAGRWVVTAPGEDRLAAAREELKLAPGAPVPLQIGVSYAGQTLLATKTIFLGASTANPSLVNVMIDGKPATGSDVVVNPLVKVPLSIDADDTQFDVVWLTSCGTMHDFDLPQAYLEVEADDPQAGELAVVLRDGAGGVAWNLWAIHAVEATQ
jgi:hypothetical protein